MRHEEYKDLLALEVAGGVDPSERGALDAHLSSCAECRAELDELRDAAAALVYTVAPVRPRAELRAGILAQVKTLKAQAASAEAETAPPAQVHAAPAPARPAPGLKEEARRLLGQLGLWDIFRARPSLGFGAVVAVLLIGALGLLSVSLMNRTLKLRMEVSRLIEQLDVTGKALDRERGQLARALEVNEMLTAPGASQMTLAGTKTAPGARARVVYDQDSGRALLLAYDLPPAPAGKAYQLWFIDGQKPLPGGVFKTDPAGRGRLEDRLPSGVRNLSAFAVTLEDERGVQTPAGDMYLLGSKS